MNDIEWYRDKAEKRAERVLELEAQIATLKQALQAIGKITLKSTRMTLKDSRADLGDIIGYGEIAKLVQDALQETKAGGE